MSELAALLPAARAGDTGANQALCRLVRTKAFVPAALAALDCLEPGSGGGVGGVGGVGGGILALLLSSVKSYIIAHKTDANLLDTEICHMLAEIVEKVLVRPDTDSLATHMLQDISCLLVELGQWPSWNPLRHILDQNLVAARVCSSVIKAVSQKSILAKRSLHPELPSLLESLVVNIESLLKSGTSLSSELICVRLRTFRLLLREMNKKGAVLSPTVSEFVEKLTKFCCSLLSDAISIMGRQGVNREGVGGGGGYSHSPNINEIQSDDTNCFAHNGNNVSQTQSQYSPYLCMAFPFSKQVLKLSTSSTEIPNVFNNILWFACNIFKHPEVYEALILERVTAVANREQERPELGQCLEVYALALHVIEQALGIRYNLCIPMNNIVQLLSDHLVSPYMIRASGFEDFFDFVGEDLGYCTGVWAPTGSAREAAIGCLRKLLDLPDVRPGILNMARQFMNDVSTALTSLWNSELSGNGDNVTRFMYALQTEARLSVFAVVWGYASMQDWGDENTAYTGNMESGIAEGYDRFRDMIAGFVRCVESRPSQVFSPSSSLRVLLFSLCNALSECGSTAQTSTRPMLIHSLALFAAVTQTAPEVQLVALVALGDLGDSCSEGINKELSVLTATITNDMSSSSSSINSSSSSQAFSPGLNLILTLLPTLTDHAFYAALHCVNVLIPLSSLNGMETVISNTMINLCNVLVGLPWGSSEMIEHLMKGEFSQTLNRTIVSTLQCSILTTILTLIVASHPQNIGPVNLSLLDNVLALCADSVSQDPESESVLDCVIDIVRAAVDKGIDVESVQKTLLSIIRTCTTEFTGSSTGCSNNSPNILASNNNYGETYPQIRVDPILAPLASRTRVDSSLSTPKASGGKVCSFSTGSKSPYSQKTDALAGTPPVYNEMCSKDGCSPVVVVPDSHISSLISSSFNCSNNSPDFSPYDRNPIPPLSTLYLLSDIVVLMSGPFLERVLPGIYAVVERAMGKTNRSIDAKLLTVCGELLDYLLCKVTFLQMPKDVQNETLLTQDNNNNNNNNNNGNTRKFIPSPLILKDFFHKIPTNTLIPYLYTAAMSSLYQATVGVSTIVPISRLISADFLYFAELCRASQAPCMRPQWVEQRDWEGIVHEMASIMEGRCAGMPEDVLLLSIVNRLPQLYDDTRKSSVKLVLVRTQLGIMRALPAVTVPGLRLSLSALVFGPTFVQALLTTLADLLEKSAQRYVSPNRDNALLYGIHLASGHSSGLIRRTKMRLRELDEVEQDFEGRDLVEDVRLLFTGLLSSPEFSAATQRCLASVDGNVLASVGLVR